MGWRHHVDPVIEGKLYIGNITTACSSHALHDRRITHIVSVCNEPIPAQHPQSGYFTHKVPVEDHPAEDILIHLPVACQFIHTAMQTHGAVVLVHCVQGLSRSACVVAAYLMWARRMSATDAMTVVRQSREQVWINPSFQEQLTVFEACRYAPHPNDGVYRMWRMRLEDARRRIAAEQARQAGPSYRPGWS
ncbi:phosphatases II [Fomitiporia mediterranea MF3/22]|uniref:phosphatases II n=1 Tax=Fomitiporia mediterranea (strain MF3/22) TaxID=694068 RepID=UPI00044095B6|nr:phosphatases II [Fomitiporia mediterranea MF3/22]EJD06131.1 phosphatases II [Fomitiporia mediterranea MF3/22]